jgi:hypothetical protein
MQRRYTLQKHETPTQERKRIEWQQQAMWIYHRNIATGRFDIYRVWTKNEYASRLAEAYLEEDAVAITALPELMELLQSALDAMGEWDPGDEPSWAIAARGLLTRIEGVDAK